MSTRSCGQAFCNAGNTTFPQFDDDQKMRFPGGPHQRYRGRDQPTIFSIFQALIRLRNRRMRMCIAGRLLSIAKRLIAKDAFQVFPIRRKANGIFFREHPRFQNLLTYQPLLTLPLPPTVRRNTGFARVGKFEPFSHQNGHFKTLKIEGGPRSEL